MKDLKIAKSSVLILGILFSIYFDGLLATRIFSSSLKYRSSLLHRDNQKPIFDNCASYSPAIKEGDNFNTPVIKVHATDPDLPDEGGTVRYSFEKSGYETSDKSDEVNSSTELNGFVIDPITGDITTNATFDRDKPAFQKAVYLMVIATDNGNPPLDDFCNIKVTIEDINDNAPIFHKSSYNRSVPIDFQIDHEVLRTSAYDIDEENSIVTYKIAAKKREDYGYFRIDRNTGIVYLNKAIDKELKYVFELEVTAQDQEPLSSKVNLNIQVIESSKKMPSFLPLESNVVEVYENLTLNEVLFRLQANSNIDDASDVEFSLFDSSGKKDPIRPFRLLPQENNVALIRLTEYLDYEHTTEYKLTVQIENKHNLVAETELIIKVLDVNDNVPIFQMPFTAKVYENENPWTFVMTAKALDADATSDHNQVTYQLSGKDEENFAIDRHNGTIWTRKSFDREKQDVYRIQVIAKDNSPSGLTKNGEPNIEAVNVKIHILDKNDNPPHFKQSLYEVFNISEASNVNTCILSVEAEDRDIINSVNYYIVSGNVNDTFKIGEITGDICINKELDYEKITDYNLTVRAFDGISETPATVLIHISNVNDNPPQFEPQKKKIEIEEERIYEGCLTHVVAYDPDIRDRYADQMIVYSIAKAHDKQFFSIDNAGCLRMKRALDRDAPNGYPKWTVRINAHDELGSNTSIQNSTIIDIFLIDINDNAPFLHMDGPVIWNEGNEPGRITELKARDNDSDKNGPPFTFQIDTSSGLYVDISSKFDIRDNKILYALVTFDREKRKSYDIPLLITDSGSPSQIGKDILTVIIGDRNDNKMKEGSSSIVVYTYNGTLQEMEIGRVYVNDPDDWDLPDKTFHLKTVVNDAFKLNERTGMITLLPKTISGTYQMEFEVIEESIFFSTHRVKAYVNVTVKDIPEEAVTKSGSIRFHGISAEEFVSSNKKDILRDRLAAIFNTQNDNVDVFTILHSPHYTLNDNLLDVRFSVHDKNLPYFESEKLNTLVALNLVDIESKMDSKVALVRIDECLDENVCNSTSCRNILNVNQKPYSIFTNTSSFVGINAVVDSECTCEVDEPIICLNGGTRLNDQCVCPENMKGSRCELLSVGFSGDGWAIMPSPDKTCENSHLHIKLKPTEKNGLIFYMGPMYHNNYSVRDFMSLELQDGFATLYVDFGIGTTKLQQNQTKLNDERSHTIDINWTTNIVQMKIDDCKESCQNEIIPSGPNNLLNVNGPIQIGGTVINFKELSWRFGWNYKPTDTGFTGCISNITLNDKNFNLGMASLSKNALSDCDHVEFAGYAHLGINSYFYAALFGCLLLLLLLIAILLVYKHKTYNTLIHNPDDSEEQTSKMMSLDAECGEADNHYINMKVLQVPSKDVFESPVLIPCQGENYGTKKEPEPLYPKDDLRFYAYEGEGNSVGSLSSIASGTDDEDLQFNHLSQDGPGFRKLAHMYGNEVSDDEC